MKRIVLSQVAGRVKSDRRSENKARPVDEHVNSSSGMADAGGNVSNGGGGKWAYPLFTVYCSSGNS
jgi:hypothetical protein